MIDYNELSDEDLQDLFDGKTNLWIQARENTNRLCRETKRSRDSEIEMEHELALINMEIYRRREQ